LEGISFDYISSLNIPATKIEPSGLNLKINKKPERLNVAQAVGNSQFWELF
jgi:hypothetical protein